MPVGIINPLHLITACGSPTGPKAAFIVPGLNRLVALPILSHPPIIIAIELDPNVLIRRRNYQSTSVVVKVSKPVWRFLSNELAGLVVLDRDRLATAIGSLDTQTGTVVFIFLNATSEVLLRYNTSSQVMLIAPVLTPFVLYICQAALVVMVKMQPGSGGPGHRSQQVESSSLI